MQLSNFVQIRHFLRIVFFIISIIGRKLQCPIWETCYWLNQKKLHHMVTVCVVLCLFFLRKKNWNSILKGGWRNIITQNNVYWKSNQATAEPSLKRVATNVLYGWVFSSGHSVEMHWRSLAMTTGFKIFAFLFQTSMSCVT